MSSPPVDNKRMAVLFMLGSALAFAVMAVCVRLSGELPLSHKVLFRNLMGLAIAGAAALGKGVPMFGSPKNRGWLLVRGLFGLGGVWCFFYALHHLSLADATMLNKLSPFFVGLFAFLFLGEKINRLHLAALVLAFFGAMMVIKPRLDLSVLPALVGLGSAMFAGAAYATVRFLRDREKPETIIFCFSFVSVAVLIPVVFADFHLPAAMQWLWLVGIAVCGALGQFGITLAYRYAPANEVAIYIYTSIVFSAILGFLLFAETPDAQSWLGGFLILAAGITSFRATSKA